MYVLSLPWDLFCVRCADIPSIVLTGRQLLSQKSTSEKGVKERERAFLRSLSRVRGHPLTLRHQITALKKELTESMEKCAKFNDTKMLHQALQRQLQQRGEEKLREQADDIRRTLEGSDLVKRARLSMKVTAVSQVRKRGAGGSDEPFAGVWDRAALTAADSSPLRQLLIESVSSESQSSSRAGSSVARALNMQSNKRRAADSVAGADTGTDSVIPFPHSPFRTAPVGNSNSTTAPTSAAAPPSSGAGAAASGAAPPASTSDAAASSSGAAASAAGVEKNAAAHPSSTAGAPSEEPGVPMQVEPASGAAVIPSGAAAAAAAAAKKAAAHSASANDHVDVRFR